MASGVALGVEIPNIEDMGIDPWADFEMISQVMGKEVAPVSIDDTYAVDDDVGIMPMSVDTNLSYSIALSGFQPTSNTDADWEDEDGNYDEWDSIGVYTKYAPMLYQNAYFNDVGSGSLFPSYNFTAVKRPSAVSSFPFSDLTCWIGHPGAMNGSIDVTREGSLSASGGSLHVWVQGFEATESVQSLSLQDFVFSLFPYYISWENNDNVLDYRKNFDGTTFTGASLYINGAYYQDLRTTVSGTPAVNGRGNYRIEIDNANIVFDAPMYIERIEIVLGYSLNATHIVDCTGGFGVGVGCYGSSASSYARIALQTEGNGESVGLLKSIIQFLQNIVDGITALPGKIANAIIEGIKSLFIPDEDFIVQWKSDFFTMLETKFGFIYQCFEFLGDFFNDFILTWGDTEEYVFHFPGIELPIHGETYVLIPEQDVPMSNGLVDIIRPFAGTVISIVVVLATISTLEDVFIAIISGYGYFQFIMAKREEAEDDIKEWEDELK